MSDSAERMSRVDNAWLRMDGEHKLMVIVGVWLLRPAVGSPALCERIGRRLLQYPRLRQKVVDDAPGALWVADEAFDIRGGTWVWRRKSAPSLGSHSAGRHELPTGDCWSRCPTSLWPSCSASVRDTLQRLSWPFRDAENERRAPRAGPSCHGTSRYSPTSVCRCSCDAASR